jgi:UDP-glucose 4-epimerase
LKILITGAGGWLGRYLATALQSTHDVMAVDRQALDLANTAQVAQHFKIFSYDAVINCAAAGRYTPAVEDWNIVNNNLAAAINLMCHHNSFGKLINIGTGAEFDIALPIDSVDEDEIYHRNPKQSYGLSKNIIARCMANYSNCYTLRLFGCFDSGEDSGRLLKKFHSVLSSGQEFNLQDRPFDMISAADFATVIRSVLAGEIFDNNLNCVYAEKTRLSDILKLYCDSHSLDSSLLKVTGDGLCYTGSGDRLSKYDLPLHGLTDSITHYQYETQSK